MLLRGSMNPTSGPLTINSTCSGRLIGWTIVRRSCNWRRMMMSERPAGRALSHHLPGLGQDGRSVEPICQGLGWPPAGLQQVAENLSLAASEDGVRTSPAPSL
jgi:hypothetical protein